MRSLVFIILYMLYFFSAFNRGLYFEKDIYGIHLIIYILFIILMIRFWVQKESSHVFSFFFLLIFPLLYLLSFFYAASPLGSLNLALRWMTYVSFFFILFWSVYESNWIKKWLPMLFQLSGVAIALQMYVNELGWLESDSVFILGRFAGVFQYPNTLGMVMGIFIIFSVTLLMKENISKLEVAIYLVPLSLYFYIFAGSFSRGMFIFLPLILLVLIFLQTLRNQILIAIIILSNLIYSVIILTFDLENIWTIALLLLFSGLSYYLYDYAVTYLQRFGAGKEEKLWKRLIFPLVILMSSVALILDFLFKGLVYQFLPNGLQATVDRMSQSSTFRERMLFNEDSFLLGKEAFFLGHGGEGWTALYPMVQQLPYRSKRIHNGIMEVFVDLGVLGLFVYLFSFGLLLYFVYVNWKKGQDKTLHLAVLLSIVTLFLHSLMDFNQAFGTVWLITFILFTISLATELEWRMVIAKFADKVSGKNGKLILTAFLLPIFIGLFIAFQFAEAEKAHSRASNSAGFRERVYHLETAAEKNKYNPIFLYEYGDALRDMEGDFSEEVMKISDDLAALEPKNAKTIEMSASLAHRIGKDDVALARFLEGIELDNFDKKMHRQAFQILLRERSFENAEQVLELYDQLEKDYEDFLESPIGGRHNSREFEITDGILQQVSTAYYVLDEARALLDLIEVVEDEDIQIEVIAKAEILLKEMNALDELADLEKEYEKDAAEIAKQKARWLKY